MPLEAAELVTTIGEGGGQACSVTGATIGVTFAATTAGVAVGAHTLTLPPCARDGRVHARRRARRRSARRLVLTSPAALA